MDILIYKGGISNEGAKKILDRNNIKYDIVASKKIYDYIVKPPGVLKDEIKIDGKVICDIELIYMLYHPFIIGITGSSGKTTTSLLINEILSLKYKTILAGNIGIPFGDVYKDNNSIYVLELSSFELESCISLQPRIAVMLNITDAHLDYHKTMANYINSKMMITKNQDEYDFLIYNYDDEHLLKAVASSKAIKKCFSLKNKKVDAYLDNNKIITKKHVYRINDEILHFEGDICNLMASILVGELCNVDYDTILKTVNELKKPKYRMERIGQNIYNDAKSTNILSTVKQIKSFKNVELICGGYDRGNDLDFMKQLFSYVDKFYLYGANSKRVASFLASCNVSYQIFDNLKEATLEALKSKNTIIFSPMAPSYDQYSSYVKRGEEFEKIVKEKMAHYEPLD